MHSQYMPAKPYTSATLPRRLPSMINKDNVEKTSLNKSSLLSPESRKKEILGSNKSEIKNELICPPSNDRTLSPSLNYLRTPSTSDGTSAASSLYPSALSTIRKNDNSKNNYLDSKSSRIISSNTPNALKSYSSSKISSEDLKYNSLPRKYKYGITNTNLAPSPSYSSTTSYSNQQQERASSVQPSYKRISPHCMSTYYSPKSAAATPIYEGSQSRRKYITKSEAASSRPSSRPW